MLQPHLYLAVRHLEAFFYRLPMLCVWAEISVDETHTVIHFTPIVHLSFSLVCTARLTPANASRNQRKLHPARTTLTRRCRTTSHHKQHSCCSIQFAHQCVQTSANLSETRLNNSLTSPHRRQHLKHSHSHSLQRTGGDEHAHEASDDRRIEEWGMLDAVSCMCFNLVLDAVSLFGSRILGCCEIFCCFPRFLSKVLLRLYLGVTCHLPLSSSERIPW